MVRKPPHSCIVEPYNASGQPVRQFWQKWVMVVNFVSARGRAPHVARGRKTLQMHGFPMQTYGISAITLILRRESKFFQVKFLVFIHSACSYKNYALKYSQNPHELYSFFSIYLVCNVIDWHSLIVILISRRGLWVLISQDMHPLCSKLIYYWQCTC